MPNNKKRRYCATVYVVQKRERRTPPSVSEEVFGVYCRDQYQPTKKGLLLYCLYE